MKFYKQWVKQGYGADFFIEAEDEHIIDILDLP
jgi:hypothetical protein